ncbi:hypothetical protein GCM10010435_66550 [Winogradskya consettensis]|uniref:Alcohol dehydrogenase-like C-terminal domain-containing protein n=1 Tax=Winogradskya consettensis TaxID=113560 RepID=A0A919SKX0_9ACTN|nr:hypothetical protein Aco04nite_38210 [Actinoplanes consettensis]
MYEGRTSVEEGKVLGHENMGPYDGGRAELLRVPYADFNLLELPQGTEHENDFTMLSDIFPTGWHGTELARMQPGDKVVVFGAGPVGLMAAHSAMIRGAAEVFVVDKQKDRLDLAGKIGATPVDFSKADPAQQILDATGGRGVVGVYVPEDPGATSDLAKEGRIAFHYGTFFSKGQHMGTGQAPVKRYNRRLRDLIIAGRAQPSFLVSHELPLSQAAEGYERFDKREAGWTKVLLKP